LKALLKNIFNHILGKHTSISLSLSGLAPIHVVHNDGFLKIICTMRPHSDDVSCLLLNEHYELTHWFYPNINDNSIVVDVGAHVGAYTVRACRKAKLVISIEPFDGAIEALKQNLKLNKCNNVIIVQKAIADKRGYNKLKVIPGQEAMASLSENGDIVVETDTLDNIIYSQSIDHIDFLKIDIEGAEKTAIKGMKHTLKITKNIMIEVRPETEYVIKEIEDTGFKLIDCIDHGTIKNLLLRKIP
jgi:FkbM family methyltransferase